MISIITDFNKLGLYLCNNHISSSSKGMDILVTKYKRHPIPDSSDCQRTREDSKTSMEKTAPEMAPTAAPRTNPLSVSCPIKAPVMAPNKVPTILHKMSNSNQTNTHNTECSKDNFFDTQKSLT